MSEILEHATRLFAERGYDGTTLQDIADAIGITRPGLYNYISSKEQLLAALVRDVSENTAHTVRAVRLRTDLSSVEKLRTVVRALALQRASARTTTRSFSTELRSARTRTAWTTCAVFSLTSLTSSASSCSLLLM